ncbi:ABC transporter ATP-binding protein [Entomohabitans teleogrylli]|uniref:ABC transporter ATP-binding protein n=1 Tax=Entomohabitans teleogrylli TaxID=1384589 RepID=UPI00073D4BD9|nr:dipeptide/oligopeptide/nickel ABC transporter ATP-binding protein [Entomohabitans teleogrylli]
MNDWLTIQHLSHRYPRIQALDDVSFCVARGACLGIVGASGSGKSTLGRILLGLERPTHGEVSLGGRAYRRRRLTGGSVWRAPGSVSAVFQDYRSSVNPGMTVEQIVAEPLWLGERPPAGEQSRRIAGLLEQVGLDTTLRARYPHQLSGGQLQRVCIARAIACQPDFIVLDEAVNALDMRVQRQILDLLASLRQRLNLTLLFISHDITAVTYLCQQVIFMDQGRVIERVDDISATGQVRHPQARRLLLSAVL